MKKYDKEARTQKKIARYEKVVIVLMCVAGLLGLYLCNHAAIQTPAQNNAVTIRSGDK